MSTSFKYLALGFAAWIVMLAAYLLFVGVNVNVATSGGGTGSTRQPQLSALLPLALGLLAIWGVLRGELRIALTGAIGIVIYGVLFIFSVGPYYAPMGVAMLLAVLGYRSASQARR